MDESFLPNTWAFLEKFKEGLHISLRGKLNIYAGTTFRGWVEKAIEQKKLERSLKLRLEPNEINNLNHHDNPGEGMRNDDRDSFLIPEVI